MSMNYKFSFDDNRTIPIDLSIKTDTAFSNRISSEKNYIHDENDEADDGAMFIGDGDEEYSEDTNEMECKWIEDEVSVGILDLNEGENFSKIF